MLFRSKASLKEYQEIFKTQKVSPEILDRLVQRIQDWNVKGFRVVCFRPPTTPEIVSLENEKSGYDEALIKSRVSTAGGVWYDAPQDKYTTYDGNHLTKAGAMDFSRDIGEFLAVYGNTRVFGHSLTR